MEAAAAATPFHIVALPYPSRGLINPMINLCKLLLSRKTDLLVTFVLTEEWRTLLGSHLEAHNLRVATIPDGIILPQRLKTSDLRAFSKAVMTKMVAPFEDILDGVTPPASMIVTSTELRWVVDVGNRRNIPVVSLWTMTVSFFSMLHRRLLHEENQEAPHDPLCTNNHRQQNHHHISEISPTIEEDFKRSALQKDQFVIESTLKGMAVIPKAKYLLISSVYELETQAIETMKKTWKSSVPIHVLGPLIPYFELNKTDPSPYTKWLDSQPSSSVLYISFGSFLSVSKPQMHEIIAGLKTSGVRFLWMAGSEVSYLQQHCGDDEMGLVIPWCDQLKVLSHPSVGGFWTHCGWNSTLEAMFSGVPMLTFPLFLDQLLNSQEVVEKWKIGWRVRKETEDNLVTRDEIAVLVKSFMDPSNGEMMEMRNRAKDIRGLCLRAVENGGSSQSNLDAFINDFTLA